MVVAQNEEDEKALNELYQHGLANGSKLELLDSDALYNIEPLAKTHKKFLWSPNTWSASPKHLLSNLIRECKERGVIFIPDYEVQEINESSLLSKNGDLLSYDVLINAAGGHALKLAISAGLNTDYSILPFKGLYLKSKQKVSTFRRHVYPVPDPR